MERKFLEELGLEKEAIDKIMAENGKDIEAQKALTLAESEKLKKATETISQLQDTVKKFDGVDVEKLKSDVATYLKKRPTEAMLSKGGDGKGLFVMHNTRNSSYSKTDIFFLQQGNNISNFSTKNNGCVEVLKNQSVMIRLGLS